MENKTILIVDDDPLVLDVLQEILTSGGYSVLKAENGKDGIAVAREKKPDLVLLDLNMPGMGGGEASRILNDDPNTRKIPIGFLSGLMTKQEVRTHETGGNFFWIAKPVGSQELLRKIKENLA